MSIWGGVRTCGCVQVLRMHCNCCLHLTTSATYSTTHQARPTLSMDIPPTYLPIAGHSTYVLTNCYESHVSLTMSCLPLSLLALSALSCAGPKCYNPPKGKTNKQLMRVALSTVCLAGDANLDRRIEALQVCDWWLCRLQQCRQMLHMYNFMYYVCWHCITYIVCWHCITYIVCWHCITYIVCWHCITYIVCWHCITYIVCWHCITYIVCWHCITYNVSSWCCFVHVHTYYT